jgi:hypothetical protein
MTNPEITKLQVPISKDLRIKAEEMALEHGFSSLQEFIRVTLSSFVKTGARVSVLNDSSNREYVTKKMADKYRKSIREFKRDLKEGKIKDYASISEVFEDLGLDE